MAAHHSLNERRIIAKMLHRKTTVAKLALHLGRRRNFWHNLGAAMAAECWPVSAHTSPPVM